MKLAELLEKYHWADNPEVYDDLAALDHQPYCIITTLVDRKHRRNEVQVFSCSEKVNAQQRLASLKAEPEVVSILVTRGDNVIAYVRVGPHWESQVV